MHFADTVGFGHFLHHLSVVPRKSDHNFHNQSTRKEQMFMAEAVSGAIRWRVINATFFEHPMHLHGAFYKLLTLGDAQSETVFAEADRQSVVTENLGGGHTMMMEWKPQHPSDATLHIASGETYDFEFQPKTAGEIPLQVENIVNDAKLETKVVVQ